MSGFTDIQKWIEEEDCHSGAILAFTDPKTGQGYFGGGRNRELSIPKDAVLLDVGCRISRIQCHGFPATPPALAPFILPTIAIDWPDYGIPADLPRNFWTALLEELRKLNKPVLVACVGGHGRTGTALSILAALTGASERSPISYIRKHYCAQAVETVSQIRYIEYVLGKRLRNRPAVKPRKEGGL